MKSKSKNPNYTPAIVCWKYTDPDGEKCAGESVVESQAEVLNLATEFLRRFSHAYHCGVVRDDIRKNANNIANADDGDNLVLVWKLRLLKLADNYEKPFYAYSGKWKFFDTAGELLRHSLSCNGKRGSYYIKGEKETSK